MVSKSDYKQNVGLADYSGIKVGGKAAWFVSVDNLKELIKAVDFGATHDLQIVPLGGGTNMFYGPGKLNVLIIKNEMMEKKIVFEDEEFVEISVGAGEIWDDIVAWAVQNHWAGIEALSAIPGSVGAAPVQNIGAYGVEISEVLTTVEVFDIGQMTTRKLTNADCDFSYRNSIFKKNPGRYIIMSVNLRLQKNNYPGVPIYESARSFFEGKNIDNPSLAEIRDGIIEIRWSKLPRPEVLPNCGSWFKNPIVSIPLFHRILEQYPEVKSWEVDDQHVKLSAGWLVEQAVGRDYDNGYFATYGKNALVLINHSLSPSTKKFLKFEDDIVQKVYEKFGVTLEREPILIQ